MGIRRLAFQGGNKASQVLTVLKYVTYREFRYLFSTSRMLVTTVRPVLPRYIHANLHRQTPVVAQRAISGLASSSQPVETSKPRKPSPYRLLSPESFISDFAPLHVAGWRLDQLPYTPTRTSTEEAASDQAENVNTTKGQSSLQGRRLVRMYEFPRGKEGWTKLMQTLSEAGTIIEQEDVCSSDLRMQ